MRKLTHATVNTPLSELGLGAMPFSDLHFLQMGGVADPAAQAAAVWQHAFEQGINLINTADCYSPSAEEFGDNEKLVGKVVSAYGRDKIFVVTKNGITRRGSDWGRDNSPAYLLNAAEASAARLGFAPDAILLHRRNREQPLAAAIETLLEIKSRGLAQHIGLSNVHLSELDEAWQLSEGQISFVENERSPRYREDANVLAACNERGIAYLAWSPLGGGDGAAKLGERHPEFADVAAAHEVTAQQVALAWLRSQGNAMTPIPAFKRIATADASIAAMDLQLSTGEIARLNDSKYTPHSVYPD